MPKLTKDEIHYEIRPLVADCLAVESDEVTLESNFFHDLGGESIDLIDLSFRCERHFGFPTGFNKLQHADLWQFDPTGKLKPESASQLKSLFPRLDISDIESHCGPFHPHDFFTIDRIVQLIDQAQDTASSQLPMTT
ncbi:MAG: hypothetical protein FJ267_10490 [Planctomycetes bacterium]|nr:hypothetical protein [Planctomycetota bacterium]